MTTSDRPRGDGDGTPVPVDELFAVREQQPRWCRWRIEHGDVVAAVAVEVADAHEVERLGGSPNENQAAASDEAGAVREHDVPGARTRIEDGDVRVAISIEVGCDRMGP